MKKLILMLAILLTFITPATTAYAGSLNSYEQEVISAAKQVYEYNGEKYQVDSAFIGQLTDYLSSEEIELTAEQRDEVLQLAFSNIEQGVTDGYLIPVVAQEQETENTDPEGSDTDDTTDNTNTSGSTELPASDNMDMNSLEDTENNTGSVTELPGSSSDNNSKGNLDGSTGITEDVTPEEMIDQIVSGGQESSTNTDTSTDVEGIGDTDNNVIKNTGFNLNNTFIIIAGMGMLMLAAMYVTIRSNFFALNDE